MPTLLMLILPHMDLYRYSCFHEKFTPLNQAAILIQIRTNKMCICTFSVFDEQKLKCDLCFKLNIMGKERERKKECQWKRGITDKMIGKIGGPLRVPSSLYVLKCSGHLKSLFGRIYQLRLTLTIISGTCPSLVSGLLFWLFNFFSLSSCPCLIF